MLRDSVEAFAESRHDLARFRACRAGPLGFDLEMWAAMGALGWTGLLLAERDGGAGLEFDAALTIADVFGRRLIPEPFVAASVVAATALAAAPGSAASGLASALAAGKAVVTLAFQEAPGQIAACRPACRLTASGGGFRLDGNKVFVPAWTPQTRILVTADLDGATALVLLPPGVAGLKAISRKMADGSVTADLLFDSVAVSADALLGTGPDIERAVELAIGRGTLAISAQLEGLASQLLGMTIEHVNRRFQFGQPLGHLQALRHALVDLHMEVELAGASLRAAARALSAVGPRDASVAISAAKARASDAARAVADAAVQFHGAFGYTEEADIGLFANAALRWASWLGTASAHRTAIVAARARCEVAHA